MSDYPIGEALFREGSWHAVEQGQMALCDRLEASLGQSAATRRRLLNALLHEALDPTANALEAAE